MGIPKEPRQQMINMMYLVLTALLALNISAEVLNAFKLVSDGMQTSNNAIDKKNFSLMDAFQRQSDNDKDKTAKYIRDAKKAMIYSDQFVVNVQSIRDLVIKKSGGFIDNDSISGELKGKRNYDVPTRLLVDEENGRNLKAAITALRDSLLALPALDQADKDALSKQFTLSTEYNESAAKKLGKKSWEEYLFDHVPVIAVNTILTKFQGDAKNSSGLVVETLYKKIGAADYKFDALSAKVIAPSSYVLAGQEYKADIFVSATSSTQNPEVFLGSFDPKFNLNTKAVGPLPKLEENPLKPGFETVPVSGGMGLYSDKSSAVGMKEKTGVIKVKKPQGDGYDYYPFKLEYQIAEAGLVVSPDKMNVFYIGVDNPVSVSVPGFPADKVTAAFNKNGTLKQVKPGNFIANVTTVDLKGETEVQVYVQTPDGSKKMMGSKPFRIKRVPDPTAMIGPDKGGSVKAPNFKVQKGMQAVLENFDFDIRFNIVSFEMTYAAARQDLLSTSTDGPLFSQKMTDYLSKAKPGDVFYFDKIKAKGPDGTIRNLPGIVFKLM
ncbi:MAG: GldM family protein [Chitinophagales bacterium]|nr:GldM family protein [Chitinophagales bacterium]